MMGMGGRYLATRLTVRPCGVGRMPVRAQACKAAFSAGPLAAQERLQAPPAPTVCTMTMMRPALIFSAVLRGGQRAGRRREG